MKLRASMSLVLVLFAGCTAEVPEWRAFPQSPSTELAAKKTRAETSRDALMKSLLGQLQAAMKEGGPVAGIRICNEKAPGIVKGLDLEGVRLGRTSHKLRNPDNKAPSWARPFVDSRSSKPIVLVDPALHLRALYPILLKPQCVTCHGTPEQIPAAVRDILTQRYPEDQATGFAVDDLRGWVWVEVD